MERDSLDADGDVEEYDGKLGANTLVVVDAARAAAAPCVLSPVITTWPTLPCWCDKWQLLKMSLDDVRPERPTPIAEWEREVAEHQLTKAQLEQAQLELRNARAKLEDLRSEPYSALSVNSSLQTAIAELNLELNSSNLKNQRLHFALEESERVKAQALHKSKVEEELRQDLEEKLKLHAQQRLADKLNIAELQAALKISKREVDDSNKAKMVLLERLKAVEPKKHLDTTLKDMESSPDAAMHLNNICPNCGSLMVQGVSVITELKSLQEEHIVLINSKQFLEESRDNLVKQLQAERDSHLKTAEEKATVELKIKSIGLENSDLQQRVQSYMQLSEERQRIIMGHLELLQQFMVKHTSNADEAMTTLQSRMTEVFSVFSDSLSSFYMVVVELTGPHRKEISYEVVLGKLGLHLEEIESRLKNIEGACRTFLLARIGAQAVSELETAFSESPTPNFVALFFWNHCLHGKPVWPRYLPLEIRELIWTLLFQGWEENADGSISEDVAMEADRLARSTITSAARILADKDKERKELIAEVEALGLDSTAKNRKERIVEEKQPSLPRSAVEIVHASKDSTSLNTTSLPTDSTQQQGFSSLMELAGTNGNIDFATRSRRNHKERCCMATDDELSSGANNDGLSESKASSSAATDMFKQMQILEDDLENERIRSNGFLSQIEAHLNFI
ncbi:hypothetical protein BC829DRAFT_486669 [Chytridium lagenaria]|nr:hypothetical protein BC829DRAFT_486669 [Chytridium lagenaria]